MSDASARQATEADLPTLVELYSTLESEMVALKAVWRLTDGLPEPFDDAFRLHLSDPDDTVYIGEYTGVPVGFMVWRQERLLPQAGDAMVGVIRLIFTTPEARRVGVGEAMAARFLEDASRRDIAMFDAVVPPGHRHAKNFFESHGFKARRIVMHRSERKEI